MTADIDIHELIARLNANERLRQSSHFSKSVYKDEPIVRTGRQMASYLPDRYRQMRGISRWQERSPESRGRWLSEAELFYRQARFMEDFEDDCPYHGSFTSYYPTYNDMSDRQLRGYFTWRAAVRRGEVAEAPKSFAYVYLYELINGIGAENPLDGYHKIRSFWENFRAFAPDIDRNVRAWLHDYVIYHALDPELLSDDPVRKLDLELIAIARAFAPFDPALIDWLGEDVPLADAALPQKAASSTVTGGGKSARRTQAPALPLPPDETTEQRLFEAIDLHSSYRLSASSLFHEHPDDLRHVASAVFVRMLAYYRKNRTHGLVESSFGEEAEMGYTMFGSAVFFEEHPHADAEYELDPIHRYRCRRGLWTCRRIYGGQGRSKAWGKIARACDFRLREALSFEPQLKDAKCPKYLAKIIDREIETWLTWKETSAPRVIDIDLSKLSGIRSAAAETREALLIDEEREEGAAGSPSASSSPALREAPLAPPVRAELAEEELASPSGAPTQPTMVQTPSGGLLTPEEVAYVTALLDGRAATTPDGISEDLLVDTINEKLFDLLGDTAIEFGVTGPCIIDDYRDDIRELIAS
ncbi:TerB N-terminal domain-containing protein [Collinsella sp. An307]|uniref:TerB N-terminal domain-containing protein n=1 Tax=Collinsella sp. An307 TaxID=1965630 RepID=UPI00194F8AEE|nr:TerB N-terminal domain-containing protein [Collinsella sp. An307]